MNRSLIYLSLFIIFGLSACTNNKSDYKYTGIAEGTAIQVPALTPGQVINIFTAAGKYVEAGHLLAVIDSSEWTFQAEQLRAAIEDVKIQTEIARTNSKQAEQDHAYLKQKYERIVQLYKAESVTRQELDDISNRLQNSEKVLSNARHAVAGLNANKKRLEAQIKSVDKKIHDTKIITPINGIITTVYYEAGEAIPQFAPIVEIINLDVMEVKIYISEQNLSRIKYNQNIDVLIDGFDETLSGRISWISPKAEFTPKTILTPDTRTSLVYAVKVEIENKNGLMKHGMPVVIQLSSI